MNIKTSPIFDSICGNKNFLSANFLGGEMRYFMENRGLVDISGLPGISYSAAHMYDSMF